MIFTEFYYWVTVVFMFLIHVGFCLYEVGVSRERKHAGLEMMREVASIAEQDDLRSLIDSVRYLVKAHPQRSGR